MRKHRYTISELNRRHESFDNTDIHHRFYENDVPMPREESNNSAMDLPPTYDQLFGGKKFITQDKFKLRREGFKTKKIVWKLTLFGGMASMKKSIFHKIH